jgi:general secretion pathway protein D
MTTRQMTFRWVMGLAAIAALMASAPAWAAMPGGFPMPPSAPGASAGVPVGIPIPPPTAGPAEGSPALITLPTEILPTPFDRQIPSVSMMLPPPVAVPPVRKPLEGPMRLNFKDVSLHTVLEYLSAQAGLIIVETTPIESRISVMSLQPVTVDEAVGLLNTVLKEKGYAAVRTGRTLKIVPLADAKKSAVPVTYGGVPENIEQTDQIVTHIIPVQFADVNQLKANLTTLLPTYADLQANSATNVLILTATQTDVRRVVEIVHALDTQVASVSEIKVFQLKYASASSAATLITNMFRSDGTTTGGGMRFGGGGNTGGGGRGGPGGGGGGPGGGGPGGSIAALFGLGGGSSGNDTATARQPRVTASADDRTNSLVVSAPADIMKLIKSEIIDKLDADPTANQAVFTYRLKYADATNVESVMNTLFGTSGGGSAYRSTGTSGTTRALGGTSTTTGSRMGGSSTGSRLGGSSGSSSSMRGLGTSGLGGSSGSLGSGSTASRGATSTASRGGTTLGGGGARLSSSSQAVAADLANQVYVVADADTNSLLVTTGTNNWDRVKGILDELDRPMPQVLIKVLIAEVSHENTSDLGIEVSAINLATSAGPGFKVGTNFNVASQTQGLVFSLVEDHITAALHALEGVGKVDVLSRPYILTSDNQQASIMVGESVPIPTSSQVSDAALINTSFVYQDVGIILTVTPHINPDGLVILDVYPEISQVTDSIQVGTISAPVFRKRAASSRVAIRDGATIVIGGLMEDSIDDTIKKVPILGDLPGIGPLFQYVKKDKVKRELLIFLTPHVAQVPEALSGMSADEVSGTKVIKGAVDDKAFQEHMKGLERGAAAPDVRKTPISLPDQPIYREKRPEEGTEK